jgi:hypothetical protein
MDRRKFIGNLSITTGAASLGAWSVSCENKETTSDGHDNTTFEVTKEMSMEMYNKALEITKSKIRGGDTELYFKKHFIDAAFSKNIFLWDTAFMCCFAKYHMEELPVYQALDNFYEQMEDDGFICREYRFDGRPLWPKDHPVSINPPLLAFAEIEIYSVTKDKNRLFKVYPTLKKNFEFHVKRYQGEDKLFWGDTLGMGMDNLARFPEDWVPNTGSGLTHHELGKIREEKYGNSGEKSLDFFIEEYVKTKQGVWNDQARFVDFTSQMALFSLNLREMAEIIGIKEDLAYYDSFHHEVKIALNEKCWNEEDKFYYDLGYNKQIKQQHIGMYWALLAKLVDADKLEAFIAHLEDVNKFYRKIPLPSLAADDPKFKGWGDYWLGGVWPPTTYMVLKGLTAQGRNRLAKKLAADSYNKVAQVYQATGTFWENYAPDLISYGMPSKKDFCGWTALIPIAVYHEYINV